MSEIMKILAERKVGKTKKENKEKQKKKGTGKGETREARVKWWMLNDFVVNLSSVFSN